MKTIMKWYIRTLIVGGLLIASSLFLGADVSHYHGASVPSQSLATPQTVSYHDDDDGDLEKGVTRSYNILTTGDYAGTTNIVINGKTHALSNNCVIDERTGLMWARDVPDGDIGPADDGRLLWDQWTLSAELCTFATVGDTITVAAGAPFITGALPVGRKITITGTTNNNGVVTVTDCTTSVITVSENLTDEGPVNTTFATLDDLIWDFVDQANGNSLGGHADWYVPNVFQLFRLGDVSESSPCIDTTVFPGTPVVAHWTSTTRAVVSAYAYHVTLGSVLTVGAYQKIAVPCYVRLVRDN